MLWTSHLGTTTLQFKMAVEGSLQRHCGTYCNLEPEQHSSACPLAQSCLTLCDLMDCSLPGTLVMGFSRQEYWSGLPFPSPWNLPDPGIEPGLPHCRQTLYHQSHQGSLADWGLNEGEGHVRSWEVGRPVSRDMGCHSNRPPALHPIRYGQCL